MLSLALVVVLGYKLSPLLLPKSDVSVQPQPDCDLHRRACAAVLPGGGRVQFSISPRPIPMVAPLQLEVAVTGREVASVEVDFAGINMNMGLNRPQLQPAGGGRFVGQASLPVCVTGGMDWQATLLIETEKERIAVPFRFSSQHE